MKLVIVESPTKAKTLSKFLGEDYEVLSSVGHVYDLPKKELGVDIEHDFTPKYVVLPGKSKTVSDLKKAASKASEVFLVTDPDREGESIAWHIREAIGDSKTKRISFHEITEEVVKQAFQHPRDIDQDLVDSQQARRVLDRLVGYKLSPLLWKKVCYGLSAGRVQSVAVRLIVERERAREAFHPEEYWGINVELRKRESADIRAEDDPRASAFLAKLVEKDGEKIKIGTKEDTDQIIGELKQADYEVAEVKKSQRKRNPYPPFTTSTLQQAGVNVFGFSGKRTMRAAQALYEAGLITYHRTDSVALSEKAVSQIRDFIGSTFGSNYLPKVANRYKTKVRLAQEAHEAIRPTEVGRQLVKQLGVDAQKIYELIWKRVVACQMAPAVYDRVSVSVKAGVYRFKAVGSKLLFDGWEKVYAEGKKQKAEGKSEEETEIPELQEGEKLELLKLIPSQHFTEPPARYTEATLIKKLEEEGIGRPSTYAPTISTIQGRGYVSKEGRALKPEDVGVIVNDLLVAYFPDVVDLSFTAKMEGELDEIAHGKKNWVELIRAFYGPFSEELKKADENIDKSSMTTIKETDEKCPECKSPLIIKLGRYGRFYSCSSFPDCKYSRPYIKKIGMACPDCKEGEVIIKKTKRGRSFYGCSRYPDCKWASWKDPREQKPKS